MNGTFWEWIQLTVSVSEAMHLLEHFGCGELTLECSRFRVREQDAVTGRCGWTVTGIATHRQSSVNQSTALQLRVPGPTYKEARGLCTDGCSLGSETAPFTQSIWQSKEGKAAFPIYLHLHLSAKTR